MDATLLDARWAIGYWTLRYWSPAGYGVMGNGYGLLGNGGVCNAVVVDFDEFLLEYLTDIF